MKSIDVVIPTRGRVMKLAKTLASLVPSTQARAVVVCDGDPFTYDMLNHTCVQRVASFLMVQHSGSVRCRNSIIPSMRDGVLYSTDDIIFSEGCIEKAMQLFNTVFPDDDGVVGIAQKHPSHHPAGLALVGRRFIDRYPGRVLFYPKYWHFACQEIYWHAKRIDRFITLENPDGGWWVEHLHPSLGLAECDQTHYEARVHSRRDHTLMRQREERGVIWGYNEK